MAHCILQAKYLQTKFWDEAIYYANYLLNLISICVVSFMTSVKKWCGKSFSLSPQNI